MCLAMSQINALPNGKKSLEQVLSEDAQERFASLKQSFRESLNQRIGKLRNKSVSKVKSKKPKRPRVKKK